MIVINCRVLEQVATREERAPVAGNVQQLNSQKHVITRDAFPSWNSMESAKRVHVPFAPGHIRIQHIIKIKKKTKSDHTSRLPD